ncbi:AmpG family muropeptide MFS transporter, partial [Halioglobus sp.]|nr:AmpG family muropeptide MFS transporter [Halioglobus sp.]
MTGKNQEGSTKVMPWGQAISVYFRPQVLTMLFLGFAAGLPFLLVFSTLTFWLAELDIQKATIGY